jgi:hypothetical protein
VNYEAGELETLEAPGYNNVLTTVNENLHSRYKNNFEFNMTTSNTVPKNDFFGAIWVQFPNEYLIKSSSIDCRTSSFWADGLPECE